MASQVTSAKFPRIRLPAFLRDLRVLRVIGQLAFVVVVVVIAAILINNTYRGLARTGQLPSFSFLSGSSRVQIDEGPIPHTQDDTYLNAFVVGVVNTLRAAVAGLILATSLGLITGIARLSSNWLVRSIAIVYIEIMQNTPLLVQLIFLYSGVFLTMPSAREAIVLPGPSYLSNRGLATPALLSTQNTALWWLLVLAAALVGWILWRKRRRVQIETGRRMYGAEVGIGIVLTVAVIAWIVLSPFTVSYPRVIGTRYASGEGTVVSDYFAATVLGLVLYTSAFIGEVVRSGIQAIPHGQWEAARAQGLGYFQILRLVVLPQALRVMIPPLTNQYLNLIKNSSLGAAVGFQELFAVSKTIMESGQVIPVIFIVMTIYLTLNLIVSFVMNVANKRFEIKAR